MKCSFAEDVKRLESCDLSEFHSTTYKFLSFHSFYENADHLVSSPSTQCLSWQTDGVVVVLCVC